MTQETDSRDPHPFDDYAPREIAARVEVAGVAKARLPVLETLTLAVLAGAFIAFGAMFYTVVMTGHGLGFGPSRLLGGFAFSLGLILVVVAGAELFTGNNLIVMAWAERMIGTAALLRNWCLVYIGNLVGAVATAVIVHFSGVLEIGGTGATAAKIAEAKMAIPFVDAFLRGLMCNTLVCLAVWLSFASRSVAGKIQAIVLPITAFVALGFEHSVANMYFLPVGLLSHAAPGSAGDIAGGVLSNLIPVTLGNIVGGSAFVALVYWIIYLRNK